MEQFIAFTGVAAPLRRSNVDTDQIVPAEYLKRVTRTGFADGCFASWRKDPEFILNQPAFRAAQVLVAGPDFGTGSSREHAVWALQDYGFRAIISSRFADIFRGNSAKTGLVTALVEQDGVEQLWKLIEANPGVSITVDLEHRVVRCESVTLPFQIDDYTRWRLMEGLDDIGLSLRHVDAIDAYERRRPAFKPETIIA